MNPRLRCQHNNSQAKNAKGYYQNSDGVPVGINSGAGALHCIAAAVDSVVHRSMDSRHLRVPPLEFVAIVSHRKTFVNEEKTT